MSCCNAIPVQFAFEPTYTRTLCSFLRTLSDTDTRTQYLEMVCKCPPDIRRSILWRKFSWATWRKLQLAGSYLSHCQSRLKFSCIWAWHLSYTCLSSLPQIVNIKFAPEFRRLKCSANSAAFEPVNFSSNFVELQSMLKCSCNCAELLAYGHEM